MLCVFNAEMNIVAFKIKLQVLWFASRRQIDQIGTAVEMDTFVIEF